MTKTIRYTRNLAIFLAVLTLVFYTLFKVFVGTINMPFPGKAFNAVDVGQRIIVPQGFSINVYADSVDNARLLRFTHQGDLLVANSNLDQIVLLQRDANGDGKADGKRLLLDKLEGPNGMDFFEDWLYVAETNAIGRVKFNHESGETVGDYQRIVTGLPGGSNHWRKTLRFGPDGLMYVTMGSSCNVCEEKDKRRASMVRYQADGSGEEIFALGLRNSAGFDWSPIDGQIYATDNGRDMLGDNFPHCELNKVEQGKHYGWPYANDDKIPDPDFGKGKQSIIDASVAPAFKFRPHNAPLGIEFIRSKQYPKDYHNAAIVALHGSWNRTEKDGYKVVSLHWDTNGQITARDFITGFLLDDDVIGRPADITEGPDGAMYISDDFANVIYRVAYSDERQATTGHSPQVSIAIPAFNAAETLAAIDSDTKLRRAAEGAALFTRFQCQSCHANEGVGMKALEKLGDRYDLQELANYLARPNPPMPVFELDEQQRQSLAVYLIATYSDLTP